MEHVGIEAVSRGAKKAILCDQSKEAIEIIKKNIEKTHTENQIELYHTTFEQLLNVKIKEKIDFVYIDPPYKTDLACEAVDLLISNEIMAQNGTIIIETDEEERVINSLKKFSIEIINQRKYGRVHLIILKQIDKNKRKG